MSTYTQDINNLINVIETNIPDNTSQAIRAKNVRDAMESIAYNYDLYAKKTDLEAYATQSYVAEYVATYAPMPDLSSYATKTDLEGKQDVLVSGYNIKTINNASVLGPGNLEIEGGATLVECTQAEYEAMEQAGTLDPDTIYIITDALPQNFVSKTELDAMGYATQSYVTNAISQIPQPDLSSYVTYSFLSSQGYLTSVPEAYATKAYVADYVSTYAPQPDLSSYVTKDYLSNQGYITSIPSDYITESELASTLTSYVSQTQLQSTLTAYVTNSELNSTLNAYVSHTQLQSTLTAYATQSYVSEYVTSYGGTIVIEVTQAEYNAMEQAGTLDPDVIYIISDALPQNVVSHDELSAMGYITQAQLSSNSYATQAYVTNAIANIPSVDLSSYVTKSFLSSQGYLTSIPSEYITESELASTLNSYVSQTQLQSTLTAYATQTYVSNYVTAYGGTQVVEVTQAQYDAMEQAGTLDPDVIYIISDAQPQNFVTKTELDNAGYITNAALSGYATQAYVTNAIANIPSVDLSSYVSQTQLQSTLTAYVTKSFLSSQGYLTSIPSQYITETELSSTLGSYVTQAQLSANGYLTSIPSTYATYAAISSMGYITNADLSSYATKSYVAEYVNSYGGDTVVECTQAQYDAWSQAGTLDPDTIYIITDSTPHNLSYYVEKTELAAMGYATQAYVADYVSTYATGGTVDLSSYVTKSFLSAQGYLTSVPDTYATKSYVAEYVSAYAPTQDLSSYATKSYVVDYVNTYGGTKVVEVTQAQYDAMQQAGTLDPDVVYIITDAQPQNMVTHTELDAMGYITQAQLSYNSYATQAYVTNAISSIPGVDLSSYVTYSFLSSQAYLTSVPSGYATQSYVAEYVTSYGGTKVVEVTQAQYDAMEQAGTLDPDVVYIITDATPVDLSYYVTYSFLSSQSYLTSVPSGYATEAYVAEYVSTYATGGTVDLSSYATKSYVAEYVTAYGGTKVVEVTQAQYDAMEQAGTLDPDVVYIITDATPVDLSYYVTYSFLSSQSYLTSVPSGYATEAYVADYVSTYATGGTVDLSSYVTYSFLSSQAYLTAVPSGYATESYVSQYVSTYGGTHVVEVTQREYDEMVQQGTLDPDTVYIITDATPVDLSYYVTYDFLSNQSYAKVHEMTYVEYNQLSYATQHNGDIYVLTDRQYDFDPSYYVTVADLNAASYASESYVAYNFLSKDEYKVDMSTYYYNSTYIDTYFYTKAYVDAYFVSKAELAACGYLTSNNFEYDSTYNTLKIII